MNFTRTRDQSIRSVTDLVQPRNRGKIRQQPAAGSVHRDREGVCAVVDEGVEGQHELMLALITLTRPRRRTKLSSRHPVAFCRVIHKRETRVISAR